MKKHLITAALLLVMLAGAVLILYVFGSSGVASPTSDLNADQVADGEVIPEVSLTTLDGTQVNLLHDRGEVTIFFAMSYWCVTCVPEAQALVQLYEDYHTEGLKVVVIDLDPDGSPELLQSFIDEVGENRLTWAFDTAGEFMHGYDVRALDTTIVVNAEGYEVYRDIQSTPYDRLQAIVEQLLT